MPKITLIDRKQYRPLSALISGYASVNEKGMTALALILGYKDWRTAKRLVKCPENMTLKELAKLRHTLGIPKEEISVAVERCL